MILYVKLIILMTMWFWIGYFDETDRDMDQQLGIAPQQKMIIIDLKRKNNAI